MKYSKLSQLAQENGLHCVLASAPMSLTVFVGLFQGVEQNAVVLTASAAIMDHCCEYV